MRWNLSSLPVFLVDTEDTEQGQEEDMLVDQMALADTSMLQPCQGFSSDEHLLDSLLCLKYCQNPT